MYLPDVIDMEKYTEDGKNDIKNIAKACAKVVQSLTLSELRTFQTGLDQYLYDTMTIMEELIKERQPKPKLSGLKPGDRVVMHTCLEASNEKYAGKVWTVASEPWDLCGSEVVLLEGYKGGFATEFLRKVREES